MVKTKANRRKANPLMRRRPGIPRPRVAFDGTNISSTYYRGASATDGGSIGQYLFVSATSDALGAASPVGGILDAYSEYKFNKLTIEFIPSISPANADAGSRIHIAYLDNPEKMLNWAAFAADSSSPGKTAMLAGVRGARNCKSFNAWERFTYNVPLTWRRKVFDVDRSNPSGDINIYERAIQGMVIIAIESVTEAVGVGTFRVQSTVHLRGLDISMTS
jgi:hypothetical protein